MLTFQKSLISETFWQNVTFSILVLLGAVSQRYLKIDKSSFDLIHLLGIMRKPLSEKWRGFYLEFKCNIKTHSHAIFSVLWMLKYSLVRQLASAWQVIFRFELKVARGVISNSHFPTNWDWVDGFWRRVFQSSAQTKFQWKANIEWQF